MRSVLVAAAAIVLLAGCSDGPGSTASTSATAASQEQIQLDRAMAAIKARDYGEAEAILNGVLANKPTDPYANLTMGALKAIVDEEAAARQYYQTAIQHGGNAPLTKTVTANGATQVVNTTVAAVARENVNRL